MVNLLAVRVMFLLAVTLCLIVSPILSETNDDDPANQLKHLRQKLPEILNWAKFKESFHKVYPNLRDELARQKLFITNTLKAFGHNIAFRWGKSGHYLGVNHYADWTRNEVKRLYNFKHDKSNDSQKKSSHDVVDDVIHDVSIESIELELARILEEKADGYQDIANGLKNKIEDHREQQRQKRSLEIEEPQEDAIVRKNRQKRRRRRLQNKDEKAKLDRKLDLFASLSDMIMKDKRRPKESDKYVQVVPPTNPNYKPLRHNNEVYVIDTTSELFKVDKEQEKMHPLPEDYLKLIEIVPGVNQVKEKVSSMFGWFTNELSKRFGGDKANNADNNDDYEYYDANDEDLDVKDEVFVDYRTDGCWSIPRDQGDCGSCYAFAAISLLEWLHCDQTGELVPFSEQYMVDCGLHSDLYGCDGGTSYGINKFVMDWGVELQTNFPYEGETNFCPYYKNQWDVAGYKKPVLRKNYQIDNRRSWSQFLRDDGPMLIILNVPEDFHLYKGGVHEGETCLEDEESLHAMVLVGHGVENGDEYWLIRNSHSYLWGEMGYFKISKKAPNRCYDAAFQFEYDFKETAQAVEKVSPSGIKRKLSPSQVEEQKYSNTFSRRD